MPSHSERNARKGTSSLGSLRMFPGNFGLPRALQQIDRSLLCNDDFNLSDVFSGGKLFTAFNSFNTDSCIKTIDTATDHLPSAMATRGYQRSLLTYHLPQYVTPCPSPVSCLLQDTTTRLRTLSTELPTDELLKKLRRERKAQLKVEGTILKKKEKEKETEKNHSEPREWQIDHNTQTKALFKRFKVNKGNGDDVTTHVTEEHNRIEQSSLKRNHLHMVDSDMIREKKQKSNHKLQKNMKKPMSKLEKERKQPIPKLVVRFPSFKKTSSDEKK